MSLLDLLVFTYLNITCGALLMQPSPVFPDLSPPARFIHRPTHLPDRIAQSLVPKRLFGVHDNILILMNYKIRRKHKDNGNNNHEISLNIFSFIPT